MTDWLNVGRAADLRERKLLVVRAGNRPIAIFADGDRVFAVDNRCPHMGFPLSKGTLKDGVLTCHWHAWQFDASCGGCFTGGGSPVAAYPVEVRGDDVFVGIARPDPAADAARARAELDRGLREFSTLRLAKSAYALLERGVPPSELVTTAAGVGTAWRDDFSMGLTILACTANLVRDVALPVEDRVQALTHGLRNVARDVEKTAPRRHHGALPNTGASQERLVEWFRGFVHDREEEAAERVLLTVVEREAPARVEAMLHAAIADHVFLEEGHALDFANKAVELLDHVGWNHAPEVVPTLVRTLCTGRRHEEDMMWKRPHDLVALAGEIAARMEASTARPAYSRATLVEGILSDDPARLADTLVAAAGAPIDELALGVALAACTRLARFHTRNEFSDWDWAHHAVTSAAALRRIARRAPSPALRPLLVQSALYVFLARFLNVPKHPMPHERKEPSTGTIEDIETGILLRRPDEIDRAVHAVFARPDPAALSRFVAASLREDLAFHGFQQIEAAVGLHRDLEGTPEAWIPLAGAARFIAAHAPTARSVHQTVQNAIKLQRGEVLHE